MKSWIAILLLLPALPVFPAKHFAFTPNAREAYQEVISLRFTHARALLAQIKSDDPDNLIAYHIENYIDFFTLYLNESEEDYRRLKKNRDLRLERVEQGDPNSPYFLYVQADIRLQWSLARLKFGDFLGAFTDVSKAYKLLLENQEKFPDFLPNYKDLGILHAMVGTIPDSYRWGIKLLGGLEGTIDQGRQEIEMVIRQSSPADFIFHEETIAFYAFLLLHLDNRAEDAWKVISKASLNPQSNLLHCFVLANIAMRTNRNDEAIRILQQRPHAPGYFEFPYLDFMLGQAKLRRLDRDANVYLKSYVERFHGHNFVKEAYQKLAWYELINGNPGGYRQYMSACLNKGAEEVGSDKNAQREALRTYLPDADLIRARLLFDGAYFQKAANALKNKTIYNYPHPEEQLEFLYRKGRILHGLENFPEALHYYQLTMKRGKNLPDYYACNSAIQSGLIYEKLDIPERALYFYQLALTMNPEEYQTSLHQKAKTGIERLREEAQ